MPPNIAKLWLRLIFENLVHVHLWLGLPLNFGYVVRWSYVLTQGTPLDMRLIWTRLSPGLARRVKSPVMRPVAAGHAHQSHTRLMLNLMEARVALQLKRGEGAAGGLLRRHCI